MKLAALFLCHAPALFSRVDSHLQVDFRETAGAQVVTSYAGAPAAEP